MMSDETVRARWTGPFEADLGPGFPTLKQGDEYDISPELAQSGHWEVVSHTSSSSYSYTPPADEGGDE